MRPRGPWGRHSPLTLLAASKSIAEECGIPYQTLINLYLRDCATTGKRLEMNWKTVA